MKEFNDRSETLKKFSKEFLEFYINDPRAYNIVCAITAGVDPYKIIEDLLTAYKSVCEEYTELAMNGPATIIIIKK